MCYNQLCLWEERSSGSSYSAILPTSPVLFTEGLSGFVVKINLLQIVCEMSLILCFSNLICLFLPFIWIIQTRVSQVALAFLSDNSWMCGSSVCAAFLASSRYLLLAPLLSSLLVPTIVTYKNISGQQMLSNLFWVSKWTSLPSSIILILNNTHLRYGYDQSIYTHTWFLLLYMEEYLDQRPHAFKTLINVQIIVRYFTCKIKNHKHLFLFYLSIYFFYFTIQFILKYFINPCILSLYFSSLFPFFFYFHTILYNS